jgi:uncharacterized protein (TIRG00374 family)
VRALLGWIVSIGLLIWIGYGLDWALVGEHLTKISIIDLGLLTVLMWLGYVLRAWRWRYLLPKSEPYAHLRDALMIGQLASAILPLRAGEIIRPWMLAREGNNSFPTAFASIVIERFFDLATVLILFAWALSYIPSIPPELEVGVILFSVLAGIIFLFLIGGIWFERIVLQILAGGVRILPVRFRTQFSDFVTKFIQGTSPLRSSKNLAVVLTLSAVCWYLSILYFQLAFPMFGLAATFSVALVLTVIVALAIAVPSAPGFIGVFHSAIVLSLGLFNIPAEHAMAAAIVIHAHQYLFQTLYGAGVFMRKGLTLKALRKQAVSL